MSTLKQFIDDQILNPTSGHSGLYTNIANRILVYKQSIDKGAISVKGSMGIDSLIAERVNVLYKRASVTNEEVTTDTSISSDKPKLFRKIREDLFSQDGFITWGGNDAFICPWLTEFVTPDSSEISSNLYIPSQSYMYTEFSRDIPFNSTDKLLNQNRQIVLDFNSIASFNKDEKKIYIGYPNDKDSFSKTKTTVNIDLSSYINYEYWCIGKIKLFGVYLVIQIVHFPTERDKNLFEKPNCCVTNKSDGKGFTANSILLIVDKAGTKVHKLSSIPAVSQDKIDIINGYTDFIVHKNKLFVTKTMSYSDIVFLGFKLGTKPKIQGYVKLNTPLKYTFKSASISMFELVVGSNNVSEIKLKDIKLPTEMLTNRFGITGSKTVVTTAKLAANDINPFTFYVQLFYSSICQLPYNYTKGFYDHPYWEKGLGKLLRLSESKLSDFCSNDTIAENIDYLYGSVLVGSADGISYGAVQNITGHFYAEIPLEYNEVSKSYVDRSASTLDIVYETVGEAKPGIDPRNLDWEAWTGNVLPIDIFIVWHLASYNLGSGSSYTSNIVNALGIKLNEGRHPVAVIIKEKKDNKEYLTSFAKNVTPLDSMRNIKWSPAIEKSAGAFSFPFERRYAYFGGNRGTTSHPISGYNSSQETFLVMYTHDDIPLNGNRSSKKARPVLILGGIGHFPDPFNRMGIWKEQLTQSPLSVELWAYDTISGNNLDIFSHCNSPTQPKVYMQGNEIALGTIGYFNTTYDSSSPDNEVFHGMYPLPQNGINVAENGHKMEITSYIFNDFRLVESDPSIIYYALFMHRSEYDTTDSVYKIRNHMLESRAYKIAPFKEANYQGGSQMRLDAAKAMAYWWSKSTPAKSTDPVPWFGPAQLDMHITVQ